MLMMVDAVAQKFFKKSCDSCQKSFLLDHTSAEISLLPASKSTSNLTNPSIYTKHSISKIFITSLFHEIEEVNLMTLSLTLKDKNCEPSLGHCSMPPSIVALISAVASDGCNHESTGHKSLRCWRPIEHYTKQSFMLR